MNLDALGVHTIWQPADLNSRTGYLLIVLHGRGDSADGWRSLQAELAIPGLNVLLLDAPDPYFTGFSWYGMPPDQLPGILRSRTLLEQAFAEFERQGFPPERCILFGFSQGCLMTLEFGGRFHSRLAGYVGVSGYCYDVEKLIQDALPVATKGDWLITHGTEDEVLPVERTREQMRMLRDSGFNLDYREYPKAHTIDAFQEFPFLREWLLARTRPSER